MIKHTTAMTAMAMAMATGTLGAWGCAREAGSCTTDSECAFGTTCSEDGVCARVYGDGGAGGAGARGGMVGSPELGGIVSTVATTGLFDGSIGGVVVDTAVVDVSVLARGATARFTAEGRPSTFVFLQLTDAEIFSTPGTTTVTSTVDGGWAQACNYDSTSYDETFEDFVVEVSPPRAPVAADPIIAEDNPPPAVVDVTITTVGEGSDLTTTFVLPAL